MIAKCFILWLSSDGSVPFEGRQKKRDSLLARAIIRNIYSATRASIQRILHWSFIIMQYKNLLPSSGCWKRVGFVAIVIILYRNVTKATFSTLFYESSSSQITTSHPFPRIV